MFRKHFLCSACGRKHYGLGFCSKHHSQFKRHGKILETTKFDRNSYTISGEIAEFEILNKGKFIVSSSSVEKIRNLKWNLDKDGYVVAKLNKTTVRLAPFILGKKEGLEVDHINRNKLDNRLENLRYVTHHENCMNRKRGIPHWNEKLNKWRARAKYKGKEKHIGYFDSFELASEALSNFWTNI